MKEKIKSLTEENQNLKVYQDRFNQIKAYINHDKDESEIVDCVKFNVNLCAEIRAIAPSETDEELLEKVRWAFKAADDAKSLLNVKSVEDITGAIEGLQEEIANLKRNLEEQQQTNVKTRGIILDLDDEEEGDGSDLSTRLKRDRDFSKKIRNLLNGQENSDDQILGFIEKDSNLARGIRELFQSRNDNATMEQIKKNKEDVQNLNNQVQQLQEENNGLHSNVDQLKNDLQNLQNHINDLERERNDLQQNSKGFSDRIRGIIPDKSDDELAAIIERNAKLSNRIRDIFPETSDDEIPDYVRKDGQLSSSIRGFFKSGDDSYIKNQIEQDQNKVSELNNQLNDSQNEKNNLQGCLGEIENERNIE